MVNENQLHIVATTGFLYRNGKFLILKRSEKEIQNPGQWTVPGGKVEKAQSIISTLKKEIKEECGLEIDREPEFLSDDEFTRVDGYHVLVLRFVCKAKSGKVKIDKNDFTEYAWIRKQDLNKYNIIPGVKRTLEELMDNNERS